MSVSPGSLGTPNPQQLVLDGPRSGFHPRGKNLQNDGSIPVELVLIAATRNFWLHVLKLNKNKSQITDVLWSCRSDWSTQLDSLLIYLNT
jgi:hypothetical protein